jgi:hypothetical protein
MGPMGCGSALRVTGRQKKRYKKDVTTGRKWCIIDHVTDFLDVIDLAIKGSVLLILSYFLVLPILYIATYPFRLIEKMIKSPFGKDVLLPLKFVVKKFSKTGSNPPS